MASAVKTTKPIIDERPERHTAGIRLKAPIRDFKKVIPKTLTEVLTWAREQGVGTSDPPFMRLYVINMEGLMDMELGIRVTEPIQPSGRITPGVLPAGRYASLIYTGRDRGYAGNSVLIGWAEKQGLMWDAWDDPAGHAFACRYEAFLTDPADEPDHKKWQTEVAIKLADE
ncbi:MAG TPA: GyrI-like domain-containing protein [Chloroflexota bacterium]